MARNPSVRPSRCPAASQLHLLFRQAHYTDSFEVAASTGGMSILDVYAGVLGHMPDAFQHLLVLRSWIVRPFGIGGVSYADLASRMDTARTYMPGDRIGRWTLYAASRDELVTGRNDRHLDFRVSVFRQRDNGRERIILSTGVKVHHAFGRTYLALVLPFHRFGVAYLLARAARAGRLRAADPGNAV